MPSGKDWYMYQAILTRQIPCLTKVKSTGFETPLNRTHTSQNYVNYFEQDILFYVRLLHISVYDSKNLNLGF